MTMDFIAKKVGFFALFALDACISGTPTAAKIAVLVAYN
jgi:hypothetical protein